MGGYIKVVGVKSTSFIMASNRSKVFLMINEHKARFKLVQPKDII